MVLVFQCCLFLKIYRRDSQEEIYAGSHRYPGQVNKNISLKATYVCKFKLLVNYAACMFLFIAGCVSFEIR